MKYKIQMGDVFGKDKWLKEVEGYPLVIPDYKEFQFFMTPCNPDSPWDSSFTVSEVTTGYAVGDTYNTTEMAIADIKKRIERYGIENVRQMIQQFRITPELEVRQT